MCLPDDGTEKNRRWNEMHGVPTAKNSWELRKKDPSHNAHVNRILDMMYGRPYYELQAGKDKSNLGIPKSSDTSQQSEKYG